MKPKQSKRPVSCQMTYCVMRSQADEERSRLLELRNGMRASGARKPRWFSLREEPLKAGPDEKLLQFK